MNRSSRRFIGHMPVRPPVADRPPGQFAAPEPVARPLRPVPVESAPDTFDLLLLLLYLLGIYLGVEIRLSASTPIPTVLSGLAGGVMLLKHMDRLRSQQMAVMLLVIALFLGSILSASVGDLAYLSKRTTGLLQLAYSFAIGYGFFLTILLFDRRRMAAIFGWFSLALIIGCALETYVEPFKQLSDTVRGIIFSFGVYDADTRDLLLYGRIRPKLFTSEPSAVSFGFTLFAFCWYVLSEWRWKLVGFAMMFAAAFLLMRGPTLLLGFVLLGPYELFLAPRRSQPIAFGVTRYDLGRGLLAVLLIVAVALAGAALALNLYADRIAEIEAGTDPSFFARIIAPCLVALEVMREHPIAGIGLTAEARIDDVVSQIYMHSGGLLSDYTFGSAKEAITNFFWMHWIYLGAVWGVIMLVGISLYLRALAAPSLLFCWSVWVVIGQSSGAYVSPKTWTVLYLACAISLLQQRRSVRQARPIPAQPRGGLAVAGRTP